MKESILKRLKEGGLILYIRHAEATVGQDQPNFSLRHCYTQRNLSNKGRRQAYYYGEVFRSLQIPAEFSVLVSPICRAMETGQLSFGRRNLQIDPFLLEIYRLNMNISKVEQIRILNKLRIKLEIRPHEYRNRIIIAHNFPKGLGLGNISDMGTVVIRPLGQGRGYEVIDKLSLTDFYNLVRYGIKMSSMLK